MTLGANSWDQQWRAQQQAAMQPTYSTQPVRPASQMQTAAAAPNNGTLDPAVLAAMRAFNGNQTQAQSVAGSSGTNVTPTVQQATVVASTNPARVSTPWNAPAPTPGAPAGTAPNGGTPGVPGFWWGNTLPAGQPASTSNPAWVTANLGNYETWRTPEMAQALNNYSQLLPWQQLQQNQYQYGQDFNENQRRWNEQFDWTQQGDAFNQALANRQQGSAEQQAQWANENWQKQYGLDTELGRGQLANQAAATSGQNAYWQGQIGLGQEQNRIDQMWKAGQLSNEQRQIALAELTQKQNNTLGLGQLDVARQQNQIDQMYKSGQLSNDQYANQTARLQAQNQYDLGGRELAATQAYQQGQLGIAQQQNQIDQMYKSGQISNEYYANQTARLQSQAQGEYWRGQVANDATQNANQLQLGNRELGIQDWYNRQQAANQAQQNQIDQLWKTGQLTNQQREIALAELTQQTDNAFRYADLTQQAALQRESFKNQQSVAAMQAFGRAQVPSARFIRSW